MPLQQPQKHKKAATICVGHAHRILRLFLQTVSTLIAQRVTISTPSRPISKKNRPSNIASVLYAQLDLLNETAPTTINKRVNVTKGENHEFERLVTSGHARTICD